MVNKPLNNFITATEAASLLSLSVRRVQVLCKNGRIPGAKQFGRSWMVPLMPNGSIEVISGSRGPSINNSLVTVRKGE